MFSIKRLIWYFAHFRLNTKPEQNLNKFYIYYIFYTIVLNVAYVWPWNDLELTCVSSDTTHIVCRSPKAQHKTWTARVLCAQDITDCHLRWYFHRAGEDTGRHCVNLLMYAPFRKISNSAQSGRFALILWRGLSFVFSRSDCHLTI